MTDPSSKSIDPSTVPSGVVTCILSTLVVVFTLHRTAATLLPSAGVPNPNSLAHVLLAAVAFVPAVGTEPEHPDDAQRLEPIVDGDVKNSCCAFLNAADIAEDPSVALAFLV